MGWQKCRGLGRTYFGTERATFTALRSILRQRKRIMPQHIDMPTHQWAQSGDNRATDELQHLLEQYLKALLSKE
ncbi:TPA: hypothetical protein OUA31_001335 [Klebsiella aerogenes]|nr:hypothetical protein [Klebsiella aerogenes]HCT8623073.1 hypothetical protein [Klebsiella aerogenes]HCT8632704.1 hypothetical protein [Klebsiella aerogenes]HCT8713736.1 hypothetical protein [Klebsiella aerogenes]